MATEQDYKGLNDRIRKAEQQRAVLQAQEHIKGEKRAALLSELRAAGINVNDLAGEATRLQTEIDQAYQEAAKKVAAFEESVFNPKEKR